MTTFKRTLTALDLSDKDADLLAFNQLLQPVFSIEKAYYLHIIPDFTAPKNKKLEFHKLVAPDSPVDENVKNRLQKQIGEVYSGSENGAYELEVIEGQPYQKLLHWIKVKSTDLLIVGNKETTEGSGITAKRVARKAQSSVCYVGEKAPKSIKKIVVGVDFSDYSARALEAALAFKKADADVEIIAFHAISIPSTNYRINLNYPKIKEILFESAEDRMLDFLSKYGMQESVEPVFKMNDYFDASRHFREYATEQNADLLIVGAKGHTFFEEFLYGSVTEKLVEAEKNLPILVVR